MIRTYALAALFAVAALLSAVPAGASAEPAPSYTLFTVPSGSMEPTIDIGDSVLVNEQSADYLPLHFGDIIVFRHPPRDTMCGAPEPDLVKRVIALPGQTISSTGNNIFVNGKLLSEPYLPKNDTLGPAIPKQTVPKNDFFVLGDNRAISCDSRYWGPVQGSSIVGLALLDCRPNGIACSDLLPFAKGVKVQ